VDLIDHITILAGANVSLFGVARHTYNNTALDCIKIQPKYIHENRDQFLCVTDQIETKPPLAKTRQIPL